MAHIVPRESLCLDCSEYVGQRGTGQGVFKMVLRLAKVDPRFRNWTEIDGVSLLCDNAYLLLPDPLASL